MSDGRVIEGYKEGYLSAGPNVYWKVFVRGDGSLERFEIYQQQGDVKALLAKRFYNGNNRLIVDMSISAGYVRVGLKDYANRSKTVFSINTNDPSSILSGLTMENLDSYSQSGKTMYLYDINAVFENITISAFTDLQFAADQPVITVYYQEGGDNKITSWHYQGRPQGIFITKETVDIASLLMNSEGRTVSNIDSLIQNGNDIFLAMGQTIVVPQRSLWCDYNNSTGFLTFIDSTTYEVVGSVKYPEADRVMIDNEEYKITVENGSLSLILPILYEYSISIFGASGDDSNVKIYNNGYIKITLPDGSVIEGYKGDYLDAGPNVYWKVFVRTDGSLERFEIYQQQGDIKALLAKRFYNETNYLVANMCISAGYIQVGLKDYDNCSKTVFDINTNDPSSILSELTMENLDSYSQSRKIMYLYDSNTAFADIPLSASTDQQLAADQPVITIYYQEGDSDKINSWQLRGMPNCIFAVNGDADIESLITNPIGRTSENINNIVQGGNDIFFSMGQTIVLPQRSLWYDYSHSTGFLTFIDATTCEIIGSVKYPEESTLIIDGKKYEIKIDDGILKLEGMFEPLSILASTTTSGNRNLTIAVNKDLNAVVTWNGQIYNGVFDVDNKTIMFTSSSNLGYEIKFEKTQTGYLLKSITVTSGSPYGKSNTTYNLSSTVLTNIAFDGWIKSSNGQWEYINIIDYHGESKLHLVGKQYSIAIDKNGMMELTEVITPVKLAPIKYLSWTKMLLKQRQALIDFLGLRDTGETDDHLSSWYFR